MEAKSNFWTKYCYNNTLFTGVISFMTPNYNVIAVNLHNCFGRKYAFHVT